VSTARRVVSLLALLGGLGVTACGASSHTSAASGPSSQPSPAAATAPASSATTTTTTHPPARVRRRAPHPKGPDPGTLAQTAQLPSAHTPGFRAEMDALWGAITSGSAGTGRAAFFPETAYAKIKELTDPTADFEGRLFADFRLDVAAAHQLLGAAHARLVDVSVPGSYAHWVRPGVCLNRVGYYEVPNSRLVYDQRGHTRSLGIASMISWRGVWYVVHLGTVLRKAAVGVVDDPSPGTGTPAPSSTC
jgi:hypothetical protein